MSSPMDEIKAIGVRYCLSAVYVFGSRAREIARRLTGDGVDAAHSESDVDIGVRSLPGTRLSARDRVRLAADLEDLLGVGRVDLVVLDEVDPFLALEVIRGELLYCADKDAEAEDELLVLRRAGDLAPFARERWKQILTGSGR
jgi:predicted nucleotidyltransferase